MNLSPEIFGPCTMRAVSWNTWKKQDDLFTTQTITRLYHIGHDTYFKQMLASTNTRLQRAKLRYVTYVRAAPRWKPLQLSFLLDKRLVLSPTNLNLTVPDPLPFQEPIQKKIKQMQRRMVVHTNDDCREKTTQSLSNLGTGSYGGQHRVNEFPHKSSDVLLELFLQIGTPNLIESCQYPRPRQNFFISNCRKLRVISQHFFSHCSTRGNEDPCLIFWRRQ